MAEDKSDEKAAVIFTDLDGTLIDHKTYSYDSALKTIRALKQRKIPLIICTSKTRAEIEKFREELEIKDPFISENGGAIFIPHKYFSIRYSFTRKTKRFDIIELGTGIKNLTEVLDNVKTKGFKITSFSDMSAKELSEDSGLKKEDAGLAKKREYDEAFRIDDKGDKKKIKAMIEKAGYRFTEGGRYCHIMGESDKGKAVKILSGLFRKECNTLKTIGLGDGENDIPMLKNVDIPVIIKNSAHPEIKVKFKAIKTEFEGPKGWSKALNKLVLN
ncbi:HAD-IIB family hydrolase [archaeon]|nr:HAD-IIB family hydrolase [archaeon]